GRLWVSFSASTVDEKYSVGLISAPVDADLLDPASWRKTGYPVLTSADTPEQAGPGHNSFTTDELGNTVIVYHSRTISEIIDGGLTDPGRHARARTVVFDHRGQPVFTVVGDDLLDPANASVSVQVRVEGDEAPAPVTPTITGDAATGHTLTADTGDWGEAAELTYQWFLDDEPVQGATDATFEVRPPMVGSRITVTVTGTTDGADPVSLTSEPTARVARTSKPQIAGAAKVGKTVRAVPRAWTPGTTFEYRWLADGEVIAGATDDRLSLGAELKGTEITVEVTGTKDGYATASERSDAAGPVR
ncbi:MAG: family 43 glycosylhydrolase, partial [Ornithinimicrobium sp.]